MGRQEDFKRMAHSHDTESSKYEQQCYIDGAEDGYEYAKKRLREVLGYELAFNVAEFNDGVTTESLVDKIFKRMEE